MGERILSCSGCKNQHKLILKMKFDRNVCKPHLFFVPFSCSCLRYDFNLFAFYAVSEKELQFCFKKRHQIAIRVWEIKGNLCVCVENTGYKLSAVEMATTTATMIERLPCMIFNIMSNWLNVQIVWKLEIVHVYQFVVINAAHTHTQTTGTNAVCFVQEENVEHRAIFGVASFRFGSRSFENTDLIC